MLDVNATAEGGWFLLADYIEHIKSCVNDPSQTIDSTGLGFSCLGDFGGPVSPWVILGGYDGMYMLYASVINLNFPRRYAESRFPTI